MASGIGPAGKIGRAFIQSKLTPLLVAAALALGWVAVSLTPREEEPQIVVPMINVFVGLPGSSPTEVENRITVPLERRMWQIPGVEYVYSASLHGMAVVTVRFLVNEDEERSLIKVYDQLASSLDRLPPGATPPLVRSRSIDDVPVLALTLWSERLGSAELRRVAAELSRELVRIADVSEVRLVGGERRQVRVLLDAQRIAGHGLDPVAIATALVMQNAASPAGSFQRGNREILVETGAFLRTAQEVAQLVVGAADGRPIYLRDVATVEDSVEEVSTYVHFAAGLGFESDHRPAPGGFLPAVTLSLAKRKGADAQRVVDAVMAQVELLRGRLLPPEIEVTVSRDYGRTATEKADELLVHLIVAIVSVTFVIGLFLGWRGALVVLVAVPVSFALTLFVYYVLGYTLNRVTLFALVFVTGIVVDDSIIVVENIVRHLAMKRLPPLQAAITAVNEVGNPTILATLTVIAAVLPMAFVRGLMGPYMRPMPIGASLAMTFSLLVALVAAPWFAYRLLGGSQHATGEASESGVRDTRTYRVYRRLMQPLLESVRRRWIFLAGVVLLLLLSIALFPLRWVTVKMLPFDNKSELQLIVDMPEGTTLETSARVARELGEAMLAVPEVTHVQLYAGTAAPINFNGLVRQYDLRSGPEVADVQVNFVHKEHRSAQSHQLAKRIRPRVEEIAARHGAAVKIAEVPPGPPVLSTLVAEVYGPDDGARRELASSVRKVFETTAGVVDVDWWIEAPQPKRILRIDREKAALHGISAAHAARTLRLALDGEDAGLLHDDDEAEEVSIRLQLPLPERSAIDGLGRIRLASRGGALVHLADLVRVEETARQPNRYRKNLRPVVYVTGDVAGRQESPVYAILEMAERIAELELPAGGAVEQLYTAAPTAEERPILKWNGEWQITYEVFRDLGAAFGAVLILIYFLIVGWFRSFGAPLVMMIAIPLSLVGILPAHWLFGAFFTATSMIGFIALAGIMVRNSVLLIDFVNLARERDIGLAEAVLEAGAVRFRPILLTAGTVVVGAVVILFDPIFQGLAIALMAGAIASTILTLVVVPLTYYMLENRRAE